MDNSSGSIFKKSKSTPRLKVARPHAETEAMRCVGANQGPRRMTTLSARVIYKYPENDTKTGRSLTKRWFTDFTFYC